VRLRGRQAQFLTIVLTTWIGARVYALWPELAATKISEPLTTAGMPFAPQAIVPDKSAAPKSVRAEPVEALSLSKAAGPKKRAVLRQAQDERREESVVSPVERRIASVEPPAPPTIPLLAATTSRTQRFEAQAYLFLRGGGQAALSQGELGGSQIAARIAWRATPRLGVAGRVYAPLRSKGAEVSLGIDFHPIAAAPLRLSIERRQRLDAAGRNAWSAYAAGGFYRGGRPGGVEFDGYAQAGIVGVNRRDGFVDGALRIGYRLPPTNAAIVVGAGLWAAAQPQVRRIDLGPRIAVRLPVGLHMLSAALDGRIRLAGNARPGSGAALTLASDF